MTINYTHIEYHLCLKSENMLFPLNYHECRIYDIDKDGYISNGELFQALKTMVGSNLKDAQLQQAVDKTIMIHDKVRAAHCITVKFLHR